MSDMSFNHDLYSEAHGRRHREAADRRLAKELQSHARANRSRLSVTRDNRTRLVAVLSPMVALAALFAMGVIG